MSRVLIALLLLVPAAVSADRRAKNVILFLADAGGIPTVHAASLHGYGAPRKLFLQRMPNIGLSDTSSASRFVTDSAAGMTAIVTGQKTHNGVIAQSASGERGERDGAPLKTILEYAEERGLSTGIITNDSLSGATPAALYAKANDRGLNAAIFQQAFTPRFGDGPDVMIGAGRAGDYQGRRGGRRRSRRTGAREGPPVAAVARRRCRRRDPRDRPARFRRLRSRPRPCKSRSASCSRNRKGYFLMVEWDTHTDNLRGDSTTWSHSTASSSAPGRRRAATRCCSSRRITRSTSACAAASPAAAARGVRGRGSQRIEEKRSDIRIPAVRMDNGHTGEEVLVAAQGPGAERVRGYMDNTDIFGVMMDAFGWKR